MLGKLVRRTILRTKVYMIANPVELRRGILSYFGAQL